MTDILHFFRALFTQKLCEVALSLTLETSGFEGTFTQDEIDEVRMYVCMLSGMSLVSQDTTVMHW
jgi:hypothetical protein